MSGSDVARRDAVWRPRGNPWLIAVVVTLAAFMEILDTTIVNVALPHIAGTHVGELRRGDLDADLLPRRQRHRAADLGLDRPRRSGASATS